MKHTLFGILILLSTNLRAQNYFPFQENGTWKVVNTQKETFSIPNCTFIEQYDKSNYTYYVSRYVSKSRVGVLFGEKVLIPAKYIRIEKWNGYFKAYTEENLCVLLNKENKKLISGNYQDIVYFNDSLYKVRTPSGHYGLINTQDVLVLDTTFDAIAKESYGMSIIQKGAKKGVFGSEEGQILLPVNYDEVIMVSKSKFNKFIKAYQKHKITIAFQNKEQQWQTQTFESEVGYKLSTEKKLQRRVQSAQGLTKEQITWKSQGNRFYLSDHQGKNIFAMLFGEADIDPQTNLSYAGAYEYVYLIDTYKPKILFKIKADYFYA